MLFIIVIIKDIIYVGILMNLDKVIILIIFKFLGKLEGKKWIVNLFLNLKFRRWFRENMEIKYEKDKEFCWMIVS